MPKKSTVNKAGNYTKPTMRKQLFQLINQVLKAVSQDNGVLVKQLLASEYKKKGGKV
jgi:hypothetical protein